MNKQKANKQTKPETNFSKDQDKIQKQTEIINVCITFRGVAVSIMANMPEEQ